MREILFKAKRVDNDVWVEGLFCKQLIGSLFLPCIQVIKEWDTGDYIEHYEVDPATVCFASSRMDENKVKIFSDDTIEFTVFDHNDNDTQHTGIVKWIGDRFIVVKSELDPFFGSDGPFDLDWVCDQDDTIKVCGNIHDKKEGV